MVKAIPVTKTVGWDVTVHLTPEYRQHYKAALRNMEDVPGINSVRELIHDILEATKDES